MSAPDPTPTLTEDEIDDLLYLTRANEPADLQQTLTDLSTTHNSTPAALLRATIDPNTANTPLHYAAANNLAPLLTTLLQHLDLPTSTSDETTPTPATTPDTAAKSPLNAQNKEGNTPLHWAALNGALDVVKLLVRAGADMWVKNSAGHLALFEAERAEKGEVVAFLLEAGGREVERVGVEGTATGGVGEEEEGGVGADGIEERMEGDDVVMRAGDAQGGAEGSRG